MKMIFFWWKIRLAKDDFEKMNIQPENGNWDDDNNYYSAVVDECDDFSVRIINFCAHFK